MVRAAGCLILYLPAYSPDFNPIEELFSTCTLYLSLVMNIEEQNFHSKGLPTQAWIHYMTRW